MLFFQEICNNEIDDDDFVEIYVITNDAFLKCFEQNSMPKVGLMPIQTGSTMESITAGADFNYDGVREGGKVSLIR